MRFKDKGSSFKDKGSGEKAQERRFKVQGERIKERESGSRNNPRAEFFSRGCYARNALACVPHACFLPGKENQKSEEGRGFYGIDPDAGSVYSEAVYYRFLGFGLLAWAPSEGIRKQVNGFFPL
jgi:hypothetical protein